MSQGQNTGSMIKGMVRVIVYFEILCLWLAFGLGVISSVVDMSDLCFPRYSPGLTGSAMASNVTIRADARYSVGQTVQGASAAATATQYNQWKRASMSVTSSQNLEVKVTGEVSLCRAYLPRYHLQDATLPANNGNIYYTRSSGAKIPIPRIDENTTPLTLIFNARTRGWRNLTEVYNGDIMKVILKDNPAPTQTIATSPTLLPVTATQCNALTDATQRANCLRGVNANQPATYSAANCSSHSTPQLIASCQAQFAATPPGPQGLTVAQCNVLPPNLVSSCLSTRIVSSTPTPPTPPAPPAASTPVSISAISVTDTISGTPTVGNCSQGQRTYSPVCGRYSLWNNTTDYYPLSSCNCEPLRATGHGTYSTRCLRFDCQRHSHCFISDIFGCTFGTTHNNNCYHRCYICSPSRAPEPYLDNGSRTESRFTNTTLWLDHNYSSNPQGSNSSCALSYSPLLTKFWYSARDAAGLQYRFHNAVYPGASIALGSNYNWAQIVNPAADVYNDQYDGRKIYSDQYDSSSVAYYQMRFHGSESYTTQTGGYVLQLLQTKCRRVNGNYLSDSFANRGAVEYLILPHGQDPNATPSLASAPSTLAFVNGIVNINTGSQEGFMWFKIKNRVADYPDSVGSYRITISGSVNYGSFTVRILSPLFEILRNKVNSLALGTFEKITCYQRSPSDSCINFFNYIKAMLMLYIIFLGFRFILGADIKHNDLIKSILKIVILIGLMNGGTFEFFRENIFPLVTGFSDQIIANMSGFSMLSSTNSITNPFMFIDALFSKMFMNETFLFQILTIMGMGITGVFYFLIVVVSIIVFIIAAFRAMAVYIMALLATALLIGVAPIFISFILFERTYYLFENWAKFTFRYMMEPVIVMAGIIILTQLFTLYIDQVLSYSLCWKCALPFRIPFASLLPFPGLQNIPLFCLYWFSPWGLDPINDPLGMDLAMIVGLAMVAYSAYGYVEFADKIARRLVGGAGGPSSITLGSTMNQAFGNKIKDAALVAQDELAKQLGGDKKKRGGPDAEGSGLSMGPSGDGEGGKDGASGALKSGKSSAGITLGGVTDSSSSTDGDSGTKAPAKSPVEGGGPDRGGAETPDTDSAVDGEDKAKGGGAAAAAIAAVTGGDSDADGGDAPKTPEEKKEMEAKAEEEKREEVIAEQQEETRERRLEAKAEAAEIARKGASGLGEGGKAPSPEDVEAMSDDQKDKALDDMFKGNQEVESKIKLMPPEIKARILAGGADASQALEDFLAKFTGTERTDTISGGGITAEGLPEGKGLDSQDIDDATPKGGDGEGKEDK